MSRGIPPRLEQYAGLRAGRRTLGLLAPLVQLGFLGLGLTIFLDQCRSLLSDTQFTWGERSVMGTVALVALGGSGLAGWIVGRLIGVAAEMIDAMADTAESARRTTELIEGQVVPALCGSPRRWNSHHRAASGSSRRGNARPNPDGETYAMDDNFRLPNRSRPDTPSAPARPAPASAPAQSVFVASEQAKERRSRRGWWIGLALLAIVAVGAVVALVYWPRLKPKPRDVVEKVAGDYLDALAHQDEEKAATAEHGRGAPGHQLASGCLPPEASRPSDQGFLRISCGLAQKDR